MKNKSVYLLIDKCNIVRYVGQGSVSRPFRKEGRSAKYSEILTDGGLIQVVAQNISRKESLELEKQLIEKYKLTLINKVGSSIPNALNYSELSELFELSVNSDSGIVWKIDRFNCSNTLKAKKGSIAGSFNKSNVATGWSVPFNGKYIKCHRVVWVLYNKVDLLDSDLVINHINGNPLDNRIENLELCTQRVNTLKRTKHPKNTTGCAGIKLEVPKDTGRSITYRVSVSPRNGKRISKNFAISVHGLLPAFALAFMWRQNKINELIASDNYY